MALNDVSFVINQGGLGRPLPGSDFISSMLFYTGTLPSGFSATDRIKKIFSIEDAEHLGIQADFNDETKAQGTFSVTFVGVNGDTVELIADEPSEIVSLGTYIKVATDTTTTHVATGMVVAINLGTAEHGYSATSFGNLVRINARQGLGIFLNTGTHLFAQITGTIAGTVAQFAGGVASLQATWHYHISEYYRIQPQGVVFLAFFDVPTVYDFLDLVTTQQFANGSIRQGFVFCDAIPHSQSKIQAAQAVCDTLLDNHMPISSVLLAFDDATTLLPFLPDMSTLGSKNISVIIGQDGANLGFAHFKASGKSITNIGAVLGCVSLAAVHEDIAWIGKFNISNGSENSVPAFSNGELFSAQAKNLVSTLDSFRYIFSINKVGIDGTFLNDSHTAIVQTSDFAFIENNRVIEKAIRLLYTNYLPDLNSPIVLNANGTLKETSVAYFQSSGQRAMDQMERDGEVSASSVTVDPVQNVLSTSQLVVAVKIVPVGVARNIIVKIGYSLSIQ